MFTRVFWLDTLERAVRTAAQVALATVGADGTGVLNVGVLPTAELAGLAALASVLTSLVAGLATSPSDSASFLPLKGTL